MLRGCLSEDEGEKVVGGESPPAIPGEEGVEEQRA